MRNLFVTQNNDEVQFPAEMSLAVSARSEILTEDEYVSLLKDKLLEITHNVTSQELSLAMPELHLGAPRTLKAPPRKNVFAEFYVSRELPLEEHEAHLDIIPTGSRTPDLEGALVYVRVIKEGKLLFPEVHYSDNEFSPHIARLFLKEAPHHGDLREIDRRNEHDVRRKKALTVGGYIAATAAAVSLGASFIGSRDDAKNAHLDNVLQTVRGQALTEANLKQAEVVLRDGTVLQRQNAAKVIFQWAETSVQNPRYLGRLDNSFTGPRFFHRVADRALEREQDPTVRVTLEDLKRTATQKGEPVLLREFEWYAQRAVTSSGMTPIEAKSMAWEHVLSATEVVTSPSAPKVERLKRAHQLGVVIYSSSQAIPALKFDYQRSIVPRVMRVEEPDVKKTASEWIEKLP